MTTRSRRTITITAAGAALSALAAAGWVYRTQAESMLVTFGHLRWGWALLAVLAESGSMAALARSQRRLLTVGGDQLSLRSAVAVTYAGNAMSVSLPLVGSGVGAAFSFRQWRRRGVDTAAVGWALTVSGVMSALSFALVMTAGALVSGNTTAIVLGLSGAAVSALPALALLAAVRFGRVRRVLVLLVAGLCAVGGRMFRRPVAGAAAGFEVLLDRAGGLHATPRQYALAFALALRNWTADCVCLACAIKAVGAPVPWHGLVLAYCLAVTAGSVGLTPGGLGVVEVAMTAALVAAGLAAGHALPAVLVYRLVSFWLVVATGWLVAARISRGDSASQLLEPGVHGRQDRV